MLHTSLTADMSAPHVVVPDSFNVATAFLDRHIVEGRGAKTAVYSEGVTYTYAQIAELANRVGNGLLDLGVDLEQRVALLLLDSPQFAAAFFGTIKIGSVVVPMNTVLRPDDYVYLLNDSRARALFIHASIWQTIAQAFLKAVCICNTTCSTAQNIMRSQYLASLKMTLPSLLQSFISPMDLVMACISPLVLGQVLYCIQGDH